MTTGKLGSKAYMNFPYVGAFTLPAIAADEQYPINIEPDHAKKFYIIQVAD